MNIKKNENKKNTMRNRENVVNMHSWEFDDNL
jgi:hypothetical protein